jgi:hypothetical protein
MARLAGQSLVKAKSAPSQPSIVQIRSVGRHTTGLLALVHINGISCEAVIDTGADLTVLRDGFLPSPTLRPICVRLMSADG